jgi:hypothetical protein
VITKVLKLQLAFGKKQSMIATAGLPEAFRSLVTIRHSILDGDVTNVS